MSTEQRPPLPKNYMPWAILTTLCCCLPLGIVAIIKSARVNSLYTSGRYADSILASWKAKHWVLLTFYAGILFNIVINILTPYVSHFNTINPLICDAIELAFSNIGIHMEGFWVVIALLVIIVGLGKFVTILFNKSLLYISEGHDFIHSEWVGVSSMVLYGIPVLTWWICHWVGQIYNLPIFPYLFSIWLFALILYPISCTDEISLGDIGDKFDKGNGVLQSYEAAAYYYQKAANKGDAWSQSQLGFYYDRGYGVEQDWTKAAHYYQLAADQGRSFAQGNLGWCYEYGKGVDQSNDIAAHYYRKAAEQGSAYAQRQLGHCYEDGIGVPKSAVKAAEWYLKAAKQGDCDSQFKMGWLYDSGKGVPQDYVKALEYYQLAAQQGSAAAYNNIGVMFENGRGVPANLTKASEYYLLAVKTIPAPIYMRNMGRCYGKQQDYEQAVIWYTKAAEKQDAFSCNGLAYYYFNGKGVDNDVDKAMELIGQALTLNPNYADFLDTKGEFLFKLDRKDEATEIWEQILSIDPDYAKKGTEFGKLIVDSMDNLTNK